MITISLCMIVKNEEKILARCLDSICGLMDEIIIVDTGSTDRTKEIASAYTDKVYDFKWIDNFAAARNFAFSKATMEYIYVADADEVLDEENHAKFQDLKQVCDPAIEIVQMYYDNQLQFGTIYNFNKEYRPKLFKRLRTFQWVEPIHEMVRLEPLVFDSEIAIGHFPENEHTDRDLQVFEREIERTGTLSKRLHNIYVRELFVSGSPEACRRAFPFFAASANDPDRSPDEVKEAQCVAARAARLNEDIVTFFQYAMKVVASDGCSEICFELGEFYVGQENWEEASIWYYNAAFETESILNIHCSGELPLQQLAICYEKLGQQELAEEYREKARIWLEDYRQAE
ncbi:MAG: glycosyltransferase family 2 protein [Lachnospiraceae bacterium]|nr:glycosyltransferase family 2 protein [Lachnospiraceae bacterium]